jgi:phosphopentomutase
MPGTDHSREHIPVLAYRHGVAEGKPLETRESFADIAATLCDAWGLKTDLEGKSFLGHVG